jgi:ADP-ribosylation factor protein 1
LPISKIFQKTKKPKNLFPKFPSLSLSLHKSKMGAFISKAMNQLFKKPEMRILMLGLDGAGKTTILTALKLNEFVNTIPTVGFNVETISYRNLNFNIWDVGGQDKIRRLWRYYYNNVDCLIFVIDSMDRERIDDRFDYENSAKDELIRLLNEDELSGVSLLVYANKQDAQGAMKVQDVATSLDLPNIARGHNWHIQGCSAMTGDGLYEGLQWICDNVQAGKSS